MKRQVYINAFGTSLGIVGAILNAFGNPWAFPIWMVSNGLLWLLFFGIYKKWWELNSGALMQVGLYTVFTGTSTIGMIRSFFL